MPVVLTAANPTGQHRIIFTFCCLQLCLRVEEEVKGPKQHCATNSCSHEEALVAPASWQNQHSKAGAGAVAGEPQSVLVSCWHMMATRNTWLAALSCTLYNVACLNLHPVMPSCCRTSAAAVYAAHAAPSAPASAVGAHLCISSPEWRTIYFGVQQCCCCFRRCCRVLLPCDAVAATHSSNLPSSSPRDMVSMRDRIALASLLRLLASVGRNLPQHTFGSSAVLVTDRHGMRQQLHAGALVTTASLQHYVNSRLRK
jgi:hypothetical protein